MKLELRVTDEEMAAFKVAAAELGMTLSAWVRFRCRGKPVKAPYVADPQPASAARKEEKPLTKEEMLAIRWIVDGRRSIFVDSSAGMMELARRGMVVGDPNSSPPGVAMVTDAGRVALEIAEALAAVEKARAKRPDER